MFSFGVCDMRGKVRGFNISISLEIRLTKFSLKAFCKQRAQDSRCFLCDIP